MSDAQRSGIHAVADALRGVRSALLFLHLNADGDSVGSTLGMARILETRGAVCTLVYPDRFPSAFHFLPGAERLQDWREVDPRATYDVGILPDCSNPERIGNARSLLRRAERIVVIDHHASNPGFGDAAWVDPHRAAVGEMILELADHLEVALDHDLGLCLYTAILTDTGSFQFESTTARNHEQAARLLSLGVRPHRVAQALFENQSLASLRLLADVLGTLQVTDDGLVSWIVITQSTLQRHQSSPEDAEGLVRYPRSLRGVEIALSFFEEPDDTIRVGFRSKGNADVGELAEEFGGGGHARAAGCRYQGSLEKAVREIVQRAREVARRAAGIRNGDGATS